MEIPRRKSNDKKKRVTSYGERRLVIKNMENFYKKERKKCFSRWVSRFETRKRYKGRPKGSTNHRKNKVKFREQSKTVLSEGNPNKGKKGPGRPEGSNSKDKTETSDIKSV